MIMACGKVKEKAKLVAAHMLECSPDDLEFTDGAFRVRGNPRGVEGHRRDRGRRVRRAQPARRDGAQPRLRGDLRPARTSRSPTARTWCAAEVDTETGRITLRSYVAVDDVGNVVNPLIVEGQVHGGLAQGIAQALYEEASYDEGGNLLTGSFAEYLLPSAADLPTFTTDRTVTRRRTIRWEARASARRAPSPRPRPS
jgi:carbon-monoxide dehydrogenase large subunit